MIANAFFRAGLIEAWGRGISKIVKECLNSNQLAPIFTADATGFSVEFISNITVEKTVGMTVEDALNKVFIEVEKNNKITIAQLQQLTGLTRRGVQWNLRKLKDNSIIEIIGSNKNGHLKII